MLNLKNAFSKLAETLSQIEEDPEAKHLIELESKDGKKVIFILEISKIEKKFVLVKEDEEESA